MLYTICILTKNVTFLQISSPYEQCESFEASSSLIDKNDCVPGIMVSRTWFSLYGTVDLLYLRLAVALMSESFMLLGFPV